MSGNKYALLLTCPCGLRCHAVNNLCSHHASIDNWCPALLAPFSAIKRSSPSVVCVSGSHCSRGAYRAVAETWSWLKSATAQCTEDTHSYFGACNAEDETPFPLSPAVIEPMAPCFPLFPSTVFRSLCWKEKKCFLRPFEVERLTANLFWWEKYLKTGISRHAGETPEQFFFRQEVITCYITMQLITAYGELITCLSAELN